MSTQNGNLTLPDLKGTPFTPQEFACKCGCGLGYKDMDPMFIRMLIDARKLAGTQFRITSAIRCPAHNTASRGKSNSAHLRGYAADISAPTSAKAFKILSSLMEVGFVRIGYNDASKFFHVDNDPTLPQEVFFDY